MTAPDAPEERVDRPLRILIWILVLGALGPALDTTVVNVALPTLGSALHAGVSTSQWTITGYLLAMGIAMPVTRWLSERFGAKRVWLFSLVLFLAGSVLAGAAWNMPGIIAFRVVQGLAAGLIMPILTTMMVEAAGRNRLGAAMTTAMLPIAVLPVFGPVIGGLIVSDLGWRWIFYVNVPICVAATWLAYRKVPAGVRGAEHHKPLDVLGLLMLCPGLGLIIYGLSQAAGVRGFAAPGARGPLAVGAVLTVLFALHAQHTGPTSRTKPLINLRVLRTRSFAASSAVLFLSGLSVYGPLLLLSLYYEDVQGRSVMVVGLMLAPQGVGALLPRGIAGKLSDRMGPRPIVLVGLLLTALGTLAFVRSGPDTGEWLLAVSLFVRGAGLTPVTIAVMAGAFRDVPPAETADASSTIRIMQQIGGSFGAAVLAIILAGQLNAQPVLTPVTRGYAFDTAFWWAVGLIAIAVIPALLLPGSFRWNKRKKGPGQHKAGLGREEAAARGDVSSPRDDLNGVQQ